MKLYLARHGESEPHGIDDERPLSERGKLDIQHLADLLSPLNLKVSYLFHSPKLRAQQTAAILAKSFHIENEIEIRKELDPMASVSDILDECYALDKDILLVGHLPFMGRLAAKLVTGSEDKEIVLFKAGSLLCLEQLRQQEWIFCWMLNPELFKE